MDPTWWMNAKGTKTDNPNDFQNQVEAARDKFIVVDFFMPMCKYCVQFMPEWNKIVDEFKEQYGEQVQFLKVDGTQDHYTSSRYSVSTYPTFIILEPNTHGDAFNQWRPIHRSFDAMKKWIHTFAGDRLQPINTASEAKKALAAQKDNMLRNMPPQPIITAPVPYQGGVPGSMAELMSKQTREERRIAEAMEQMLT